MSYRWVVSYRRVMSIIGKNTLYTFHKYKKCNKHQIYCNITTSKLNFFLYLVNKIGFLTLLNMIYCSISHFLYFSNKNFLKTRVFNIISSIMPLINFTVSICWLSIHFIHVNTIFILE
jgi:hypothetical protein